jgi:hypothetical protein
MLAAVTPAFFALAVIAWCDDSTPDSRPEDKAETVWEYIVLKYDSDGDQRVTRKEYTRDDEHWNRLDTNADGLLDEAEFASQVRSGERRGPGERGRRGDERGAGPEAPRAGEPAPDFELVVLPTPGETKRKPSKAELVKLSSFRNDRPVALIFGSYT